jgi:UDP-N-acetylglucosamine diphosphorylase / glucose-1-phosphate thymidylyltransferase / UDP-N-acetylgalactosamine diphosphorylase / glucosamine-1-phosphate N-acetyltransferase / galactosamine-1-phosphate N-acetyltransferase
MMFSPNTFFSLVSFAYRDLFDGVERVWEVLFRLDAYLVAHTPRENSIRGIVHPGAYLIGQHILIEEDAVVEPGAYIQGPCIIGRGCVVRHGAYVRAATLAGAGSLIGHATETKHAVLLPESKAAHFAYVGDSILGNRVNLGAGTKLANWRLGGGAVTVKANGQRYSSGLEKMGAIIGDDSQLGCNVVCNPGTLLGPRCAVYALTSVYGYHPADTVLKSHTL